MNKKQAEIAEQIMKILIELPVPLVTSTVHNLEDHAAAISMAYVWNLVKKYEDAGNQADNAATGPSSTTPEYKKGYEIGYVVGYEKSQFDTIQELKSSLDTLSLEYEKAIRERDAEITRRFGALTK